MMSIPLEGVPAIPKLSLDYLKGREEACRFYPGDRSLDAIARFAARCSDGGARRHEELGSVLEAQQTRWGADPGPVERLRAGAVAVVTGQQPGLFTGPLYAVLKALTAVKLARHLTGKGIEAVPVFWIASEDHDHDEISWAAILDAESNLQRITADLSDGNRRPVGWLRFSRSIEKAIERSFDAMPPTEFREAVFTMIRETYRPDASPVDAFAGMMAHMFDGTGLLIADPLDSGFRALTEGTLRAVVEKNEDIRRAVLERSREISEAGYTAQVRVNDEFTGLFTYRGRSREPLVPGDVARGVELSPNVLTRPVVQDSVFPTVAYVGGPAEIAYYAQAAPIYECLDLPMPPLFPRISATIVDPPIGRVLKKYGIELTDVFGGAEALRRRAVGQTRDTDLFETVRDRVSEEMESLRGPLTGVDQTLGGALDKALGKVRHQVDALGSRYVRAAARRDEVLERQLENVRNRLYPENKLQERIVNVTSFLVRYGAELIPMIDERLELDGSLHQVIEL